jgi:hypothetical protein
MSKTFSINGRNMETYQMNNRQLVDLIKNGDITEEDKSFLLDKVLDRFEYETCPRKNETNDDVFARFFSDYVNNCSHNECRAAERMASDHRTLQSEMFQLCMAYIKNLAENAKEGRFDTRNEYACKTSQKMLDYLDSINYPY